MRKKLRKFFAINIFITTFLLSCAIVIIKIFIPIEYKFIEPVSIYGTLLSSVIFIYGFILSPYLAEYKESERILTDIKSALWNIQDDTLYIKWLQPGYDLEKFNMTLSKLIDTFFYKISDGIPGDYASGFVELNSINLAGEKLGITANHMIRLKQEISILKKSFLRITEIKNRDVLPHIIHQLKNFMTAIAITILLFLNMSDGKVDLIAHVEASIMLFLFSFLYIYLSFVISSFDNPFDKRRFSWYLDLEFLKTAAADLKAKIR